MEKLSNSEISISISEHGAELQSIKKNNVEYLWQGDPAFWGRRSPVLFPIVGSLCDKKTKINGVTYEMGQHGFARDMDFELVEKTDDLLKFRLASNEETHKKFPYDFCLEISYRIHGSSADVIWDVKNTGSEEMFFQIGAHPAFNYPDFDEEAYTKAFMTFEKGGKAASGIKYIKIEEKGCANTEKRYDMPLVDGRLPLDIHTFDRDAYIVEDAQIDKATLLTLEGKAVLSVAFESPLAGIWSPASKNAPFVCIEPWYGRCDRMDYQGEFKDRDHVNRLAAGGTFHSCYTITIE